MIQLGLEPNNDVISPNEYWKKYKFSVTHLVTRLSNWNSDDAIYNLSPTIISFLFYCRNTHVFDNRKNVLDPVGSTGYYKL